MDLPTQEDGELEPNTTTLCWEWPKTPTQNEFRNLQEESNVPDEDEDELCFSEDEEEYEEYDLSFLSPFGDFYGDACVIPGDDEFVREVVYLGICLDGNIVVIPEAFALVPMHCINKMCEPLIAWDSMEKLYKHAMNTTTQDAQRIVNDLYGYDEQPKLEFDGVTLINTSQTDMWRVDLIQGRKVVVCTEL